MLKLTLIEPRYGAGWTSTTRGSVETGGAGAFAGTGFCARRMEGDGARRRATAMRRIFTRSRWRKAG
jgi:hypothetical protein